VIRGFLKFRYNGELVDGSDITIFISNYFGIYTRIIVRYNLCLMEQLIFKFILLFALLSSFKSVFLYKMLIRMEIGYRL